MVLFLGDVIIGRPHHQALDPNC